METAHMCTPDELRSHFSVSMEHGLSDTQAKAALAKYGPNELPAEVGKTYWELILEQFDDLLVKILLLAACISLFLAICEEHEDPQVCKRRGR